MLREISEIVNGTEVSRKMTELKLPSLTILSSKQRFLIRCICGFGNSYVFATQMPRRLEWLMAQLKANSMFPKDHSNSSKGATC